ncbi:hypothetical protein C1752_01809 [Acaryochloris thomasi RCC1774]|uniref:STAS/SEC14 domain-containing protein n=1 Tax=Acaryochloris thomasi RCC1774 TaxID=1764569 RepID=A0A2W1JRV3_9CYAN|nr:hypothetical protein [Acaryochloris thomasi]PZD73985.1 hypothetical protein C1752_01809 [Acaryochloris thomasi RCC1774]
MPSVQVTSQINLDLDQLIEGVAQLDTPDLEKFLAQVSHVLARRKIPNQPEQETELLQLINQGLPDPIQERYDFLRAKCQAETLTLTEHQELLKLIDTAESSTNERLGHLITLASLRQVSLPELMKQLDIQPPAPDV